MRAGADVQPRWPDNSRSFSASRGPGEAVLVGVVAVLAVLIASGGVYAVISHAVERRTHELGVRLALGASGTPIAQTVLRHNWVNFA